MPRLLITAGPTHEPIDSVRYIGNRSSGKMGIALANAAAVRGCHVILLLGPAQTVGLHEKVTLERFRTCQDLRGLLAQHAKACDVLIMAAAVADFRPLPVAAMSGGKMRRTGSPITLQLEPTPDLLAEIGANKRGDQCFVGFALEPKDEMIASGLAKFSRKRVDFVVANPLETMDSSTISAVLLERNGAEQQAPVNLSKEAFAEWLLDRVLPS